MALAGAGDPADRVMFCDTIQKNIQYYKYRVNYKLSTHAIANYTRTFLADSLRERMYACDSLIGGFDKEDGASLYYLDYLATLQKLDKAAFG